MTPATPPLTAASERLLAELAESPLPGARYAHHVMSLRLPAIEAEARALDVEALVLTPVPEAELRGRFGNGDRYPLDGEVEYQGRIYAVMALAADPSRAEPAADVEEA